MSVIETDRLGGPAVVDHADGYDDDNEIDSRDPSRLPIGNLDTYKTWCQKVKDDWDPAAQ